MTLCIAHDDVPDKRGGGKAARDFVSCGLLGGFVVTSATRAFPLFVFSALAFEDEDPAACFLSLIHRKHF